MSLAGPGISLAGVAKQPIDGRRAAVAIRPEEFAVGAPDGPNTIAGRIDNVEYSGRDALLDVVTASGAVLHVRGPVTFRRGDEVRVHVPPERVLVYRPD